MTKFTDAGRLLAKVCAAVVSSYVLVDPDLWGHLRFGLDTLRGSGLTAVDPYSFTQDMPWVNHEWLSEVVLAVAYRAGGMVGALLMKAGLLAATFAVMTAVSRQIPASARWWMLSAAIVAVTPAANTIRPQIWTLLALAVLTWALWGSRPRLYLLPPLFAVWANLHGGWIVGVGVVGAWTLGRLLDARALRAVAGPVLALVLAVLATAVNPYGFRLWEFLWSTVGVGREITEWRPIWQQTDFSLQALWAVIWTLVLANMRLAGRSAVMWTGAIPVVGLGVSSAFVARLTPLYAVVALAACAASWRSRMPASQPPRPLGFAILDGAIVLVVSLVVLYPATRCLRIVGGWTPDLNAASALDAPSVEGRLVLPFDWGEYAIWHFGPRLRVSIDGRRETVYSDAVVREQTAAAYGLPAGVAFVDRTRPEYVWLRRDVGARTAAWLEVNGYVIDVETDRSFIARRADRARLVESKPASACFP